MAALFSIATLASGCASGKARLPRNRSTISLENVTPGTPQETVFAGTVRDDTDNPLPGVNVVVIEEVTGRKTATTSDASGRFAIPSLSSGIYRVDVTLSGFNTATMEHLSLKQGEITRAFVALRLDSSITVVIVGAVAVDPMSNGISTTFPQDLIDKLPIH